MGKKSRVSVLAPKWERISRVRSRFRKCKPWLRFPQNDDGDDIVQSTKSLAFNHEVLRAVFEVIGLKCAKIKSLKREVEELFLKIPYVPELSKEAYRDGWNIRLMATFAARRQKDASRRRQKPRDPNVKNLFDLIKQLRMGKYKKLQDHMHNIDDSDDSSDETNEGADNGDADLEETPSESDFEPECPKEVIGGKAPIKHHEKQRKSSGSGRSKERMQMDLLNQEIKELEEQCKLAGIEVKNAAPKKPVVEPGIVIDIPESPMDPRQTALKRSRSKQTVPAHAVPAPPNPDQEETQPYFIGDGLDGKASIELTVQPTDQVALRKKKTPAKRGRKSKKGGLKRLRALKSKDNIEGLPKKRSESKLDPQETKRRGRPPQTADSETGKTYGCSRCRYAALGCSTCRNPSFKPRPRKNSKSTEERVDKMATAPKRPKVPKRSQQPPTSAEPSGCKGSKESKRAKKAPDVD